MENNNINKPLVLVRQECFNDLVNVINSSNLPAFIIEPMLKDLLNVIQNNMRTEYDQTLNWYLAKLEEQKKAEIKEEKTAENIEEDSEIVMETEE